MGDTLLVIILQACSSVQGTYRFFDNIINTCKNCVASLPIRKIVVITMLLWLQNQMRQKDELNLAFIGKFQDKLFLNCKITLCCY